MCAERFLLYDELQIRAQSENKQLSQQSQGWKSKNRIFLSNGLKLLHTIVHTEPSFIKQYIKSLKTVKTLLEQFILIFNSINFLSFYLLGLAISFCRKNRF